jgi:hypothetical protein
MYNWVKAILLVFWRFTLTVVSIAGVILVGDTYPTETSLVFASGVILIGLFVWVVDTKTALDRQQNGKNHE